VQQVLNVRTYLAYHVLVVNFLISGTS